MSRQNVDLDLENWSHFSFLFEQSESIRFRNNLKEANYWRKNGTYPSFCIPFGSFKGYLYQYRYLVQYLVNMYHVPGILCLVPGTCLVPGIVSHLASCILYLGFGILTLYLSFGMISMGPWLFLYLIKQSRYENTPNLFSLATVEAGYWGGSNIWKYCLKKRKSLSIFDNKTKLRSSDSQHYLKTWPNSAGQPRRQHTHGPKNRATQQSWGRLWPSLFLFALDNPHSVKIY